MSSQGAAAKSTLPAIVIVDSGGSAGPWLLRSMEMVFPAGSLNARIASEFPPMPTGESRVAFVVCDGGSPSARLATATPGIPVTVVLATPDIAREEAAFAAGAFDVLVLQDATPQDIRRAVQRMSRALATEAAHTEKTRALADSRKHLHDINNSLATILTVAEDLLDNPKLDPEAKRAVALIFETTRTAAVAKPASPAPVLETRTPAGEMAARQSADAPAAGVPNRILVIEDQPDLGRLISLTLRSKGYDVLLAQSADEAVKLARANDWQLSAILSDIVMEGTPTRDAVAEIRSHVPSAGVVFMSAYAPDEFFASGDVPDDAHFLQKPFTAAELAGAMKTAISA